MQSSMYMTGPRRIASAVPAARRAFGVKRVLTPQASANVPADVAPLFNPIKVGSFELSHRMVFPPLTRLRCDDTVPQPIMAEYYAQRTTPGGLLIAEATAIEPGGLSFPFKGGPGIFSPEQVAGWKRVTDAVRAKGGIIFHQIWHGGRASHPAFIPGGGLPVSSSAVPISSSYGRVWLGGSTMEDYPTPVPLDKEGIKARVQAFRKAARNALDAGFHGVEIHGANGYLIEQFIKDGINKRTDEYGGSIENRCRFALEVVEAVIDEIGADKVGLRLSPFSRYNDAVDSTPYATYTYLVEKLNAYGLAYLHMIEPRFDGGEFIEGENSLLPFRKVFKGPFMAAGGHNRESGAAAVASGSADLIAYGRWWISNPDLPQRFLLNAPLTKYDRDTFYVPGPKGYTDYPFLEASVTAAALN